MSDSRNRVRVTILAVCGSLAEQSSNLTLLQTAIAFAAQLPDVEVVLFDGLGNLPHFNPDHELDDLPSVAHWRAAIRGANALLVATPEYGHSLPGVLKNGVDWVIGTGELERKIVGITATVSGPPRGELGLRALRETLDAVRAEIIGGTPIVKDETMPAAVAALVEALVAACLHRHANPDD